MNFKDCPKLEDFRIILGETYSIDSVATVRAIKLFDERLFSKPESSTRMSCISLALAAKKKTLLIVHSC
jgi:hypothetical protein